MRHLRLWALAKSIIVHVVKQGGPTSPEDRPSGGAEEGLLLRLCFLFLAFAFAFELLGGLALFSEEACLLEGLTFVALALGVLPALGVLRSAVATRSSSFIEDAGIGERKYAGIALGKDGRMYCAPCSADRILVVDPPATRSLSFIEGARSG